METSSSSPLAVHISRVNCFFLLYIYDLSSKLNSNAKFFADDSLFLPLLRIKMKVQILSTMIFRWFRNRLLDEKCFLIHILLKQPNKYYFLEKGKVEIHPTISLNNIQVERASDQKHLSILLDEQLNFRHLVDSAVLEVKKGISVIKNFRIFCHGSFMNNIKRFSEAANWLGDIIYDQTQNESFLWKTRICAV